MIVLGFPDRLIPDMVGESQSFNFHRTHAKRTVRGFLLFSLPLPSTKDTCKMIKLELT